MTMLRKATHHDIPGLVELGRAMHSESPVFRGMVFDAERLAKTISRVIDSDNGFAFVYDLGGETHGAMLAMVTQHWFSPDLLACDMALFVPQDFRGGLSAMRLLTAYRDWAADMGVAPGLTWFGITTGVQPEKTAAMCERLGWRRIGVIMGA